MAIKISNEPIINDDRFIVSPTVQRITANKTLVRGYNYNSVSSCLIVNSGVVLTLEEGLSVFPFTPGSCLTIGSGQIVTAKSSNF